MFVGGILPSSDILVIGDERRSSLLSIDTQSYLTSAPDGHVVALFPGATHFVASVSEAGDMRMFGNGKCVKLRVPESAKLFFRKEWPGSKTFSAEINTTVSGPSDLRRAIPGSWMKATRAPGQPRGQLASHREANGGERIGEVALRPRGRANRCDAPRRPRGEKAARVRRPRRRSS